MDRLVTSAEEVLEVINRFRHFGDMPYTEGHSAWKKWEKVSIQAILEEFSHCSRNNYSPPIKLTDVFCILGRKLIEELGHYAKSWDQVDRFADLLLEKHKLYGAAPLEKWGALGIIIRIDSKHERILNMQQSKQSSVLSREESLDDTRWDILGYCVLGYLLVTR